jgi:tetratricopeptide (TPR) repeat protein
VAVLWLVFSYRPAERLPERITAAMALEAFDADNLGRARGLAGQVLDDKSLSANEHAAAAFVLGAATLREAEAMGPKSRRALAEAAVQHLEDARDRGFPPDREAEGEYLLGQGLCLAGQAAAARAALAEALELDCKDPDPDRQRALHRLLAEALASEPKPDLAAALKHNAAFLASDDLTEEEQAEGLIRRAEILFRQGNVADCAAALAGLPKSAQQQPEALLLRAQAMMREAAALRQTAGDDARKQAQEKYQAAIKVLRTADSRDTFGAETGGRAQYLVGVCYRESGDLRAALAQFERTRKTHPDTPEEQAASFQEGELLREAGKDAEAVVAYRRALAACQRSGAEGNPWLPADEFRTRMTAVYQHYLAAGRFDLCAELAQAMAPLSGPAKSLELQADAHQAWARRLAAEADGQPRSKAEAVLRQARSKYRAAGRLFVRLAEAQFASRQYTEHLWNATTSFFAGQDYQAAARTADEYLRHESRKRRPQALVLLGESLLAADRAAEAIKALQECIEFHPRDAAAFQARWLASRACRERGDIERAEALLRENLSGELLTPASKEWRDSLFSLGELLHAERRFAEAVPRLDEALARYGDAPAAIEARYLLADACRQLGHAAADKSRRDLPDAAPPEIHDNYRKALEQFQQLQAALTKQQERDELTPTEAAMLRNSTLAIGGVLCDLGEYDAAARALFAAANRYQLAPEALDVHLRLAAAYRALNKPAEARRVIEQAKLVLARLNPQADFTATTNFGQKEWGEVLAAWEQM